MWPCPWLSMEEAEEEPLAVVVVVLLLLSAPLLEEGVAEVMSSGWRQILQVVKVASAEGWMISVPTARNSSLSW